VKSGKSPAKTPLRELFIQCTEAGYYKWTAGIAQEELVGQKMIRSTG